MHIFSLERTRGIFYIKFIECLISKRRIVKMDPVFNALFSLTQDFKCLAKSLRSCNFLVVIFVKENIWEIRPRGNQGKNPLINAGAPTRYQIQFMTDANAHDPIEYWHAAAAHLIFWCVCLSETWTNLAFRLCHECNLCGLLKMQQHALYYY